LASLKQLLAKTLATTFGLGYIPIGPGTFGAAGGLLILSLLHLGQPTVWPSDHIVFWAATTLLFFVGVWAAKTLEPEWGEDPSKIVIDEWLGLWVALAGMPFEWPYIIAGFVLFRLFDIWKPAGVRRMEQYGNGFGVMLDDLLAGIYANLILRLILLQGWL
jgi:phosphatidylglycerophosphatase A